MLQFPGFMKQYPWSTRTIPTSFLLPTQWPQPHSEELLLAMEESDFEEKVLSETSIFFIYISNFPLWVCRIGPDFDLIEILIQRTKREKLQLLEILKKDPNLNPNKI